MLTQNSELRDDGVWNWTLPAWVVELADGTNVNACPNAGACVKFCYARNGTYLFPAVRNAHIANLEWTLWDLPGWKQAMIGELVKPKYRPTWRERLPELAGVLELDEWAEAWRRAGAAAVRVHDSGDFHSDEYLRAWLDVAREIPDVLFYAYTKEVSRMRAVEAEGLVPVNFRYLFSLGGKEDHLVDRDADRHADVFPTLTALREAGYVDQTDSDLLAVLLPTTRVGIPANNIPHFKKRMGEQSFSQVEASLTRHNRDRSK